MTKKRGNSATKTVLITGSSSGFGVNIAQAFAQAGYAIILHGRNSKKLKTLKNKILKEERVTCSLIVADLGNSNGLTAIKKTLRNQKIDILINNAAVNPELGHTDIANDKSNIDTIFSVNTATAIALCYTAFAHFKTHGSGIIININSVAGLKGSAHEAVYAASKFGLRGFSESVKEEWLKKGVKMIDVYSGAIATGMSAQRTDVKDLIDPEELAKFLIGLCKTDSFFARELNVQRTKKTEDTSAEKIVFANGVFDLLHPGHIALLKFAKSLGSKLVVGINSDRATKLIKGPGRPIQNEHQRKTVLENLDCVDEVIIFDDTKTLDTILKIKPAIVVKGAELTAKEIRKKDKIPRSVEIVTCPVVKNNGGVKLSTSNIIERIKQRSIH